MLASTLLGESPPRLPVAALVRTAALFGINANQARVALSRMAARGEVATDGAGTYALAGRLLDRAARQAQSRAGETSAHDGRWHVVVVTAAGDSARRRRDRRAQLRAARLGELRDGVWTRPCNLAVTLDDEVTAATTRLVAVPEVDEAALAAQVFDLDGWARRARQLIDALAATPLDGAGDLACGFVRSAEVLRHLQRDPLVPAELLDPTWPGDALRRRYDEFDAAFRALLVAQGRSAAHA